MAQLFSTRFTTEGVTYRLREVPWLKARSFDAWLGDQTGGTLFQTMAWGRFKAIGSWQSLPLQLESGGSTVASILMLVRTGAGLPFFYSPRGPVLSSWQEGLFRAVTRGVEELAAKRGAVFWRLDPELFEDFPLLRELERVNSPNPFGGVQPRWVWRTELHREPEQQWCQLKKGARRQIRRAERKGIEVRDVQGSDISALHRLLMATAQRNGFSQRPLSYFRSLWQHYSSLGQLKAAIAWQGQRPLSGALAIGFAGGVWDLYAGNATREDDFGACYLLTWQMLQWAGQEGYRVYDFGGVPAPGCNGDLEGLTFFKSRFGGQRWEYVGEHDLVFRPALYRGLLAAEQGWQTLRGIQKRQREARA